jgi:hypothetical protein
VVESDVEQICAYLDIDEKLTEGVVELIFYYNNTTKQQNKIQSLCVTNNMLKTENIFDNTDYPVYNIKVNADDLDNVVIPAFSLAQNYPNPFNSSTRIGYSLNKECNVTLDIFNVKGQLVKTLFRGFANKGGLTTTWNGKDNLGNDCSSGIYFYKLNTGDKTLVKKMMLMK